MLASIALNNQLISTVIKGIVQDFSKIFIISLVPRVR